MCPVAWTLNGLLTSQFGDVNDKFNNGVSVSDYRELLWLQAGLVVGGRCGSCLLCYSLCLPFWTLT